MFFNHTLELAHFHMTDISGTGIQWVMDHSSVPCKSLFLSLLWEAAILFLPIIHVSSFVVFCSNIFLSFLSFLCMVDSNRTIRSPKRWSGSSSFADHSSHWPFFSSPSSSFSTSSKYFCCFLFTLTHPTIERTIDRIVVSLWSDFYYSLEPLMDECLHIPLPFIDVCRSFWHDLISAWIGRV